MQAVGGVAREGGGKDAREMEGQQGKKGEGRQRQHGESARERVCVYGELDQMCFVSTHVRAEPRCIAALEGRVRDERGIGQGGGVVEKGGSWKTAWDAACEARARVYTSRTCMRCACTHVHVCVTCTSHTHQTHTGVCVCVSARARACVCSCVRACLRACV